ncbi:MAG: 5-(carboxyamino)imidazole ribonucleotide synthase [Chthoniobacterales bacterium]
MKSVYLPGATIGVMGGGQLGRMFAVAARTMGYRVHIFTPEENGPASQLADATTTADYADETAVRQFAEAVDVITFEFENIPIETIKWCEETRTVRPAGSILHIAQNRLREKNFLAGAGLPVAPFKAVRSARELEAALEQIGRPAILKTAAFGYDGRGQQTIKAEDDFEKIWQASSADELVLEQVVNFEKEISVIVARGADGEMMTFPACENIHRNHILDLTVVPARIDPTVETEAARLASAIAEKLGLVGLLAVEMFLQSDGKLIVNELAPRPHNSGHWTIEGCSTSQFEQHVRAVCGLPLGVTDLLKPSAMVNLLGDLWSGGEPDWRAALRTSGVHLHLYGKAEPRAGRKMGHLTATGGSVASAIERAAGSRDLLAGTAPHYTTELIQTRTLAEREWATSEAVALLRRGEAVALPTETVYGLAADARNAVAVAKIFEAKERPRFDPLIVHLPHQDWLEQYAIVGDDDRELVTRLCAAFWPGPLTLVLPRTARVPDIVTSGLETVAVRVSAHPVFSEIIAAFGGPLAAPSANRFGRISPTTAYHVVEELDGRIPLIVDGGPATHGLESSIVAVEKGVMRMLRRGMITPEQLAKFGPVEVVDAPTNIESPGQLESHYAPRVSLQITKDLAQITVPEGKRYGVILWTSSRPESFVESRRLSDTCDLREAAVNLFGCLRELDRAGLDLIVAEAVPETGLGAAIMDRLRRAATPAAGRGRLGENP